MIQAVVHLAVTLSEGPENDFLSEVWERPFEFEATPLLQDSVVVWDRTDTLIGLATEISSRVWAGNGTLRLKTCGIKATGRTPPAQYRTSGGLLNVADVADYGELAKRLAQAGWSPIYRHSVQRFTGVQKIQAL